MLYILYCYSIVALYHTSKRLKYSICFAVFNCYISYFKIKVEKSTRIVTASEISTSSSSQSKIPLSPLRKESPEKVRLPYMIISEEIKNDDYYKIKK